MRHIALETTIGSGRSRSETPALDGGESELTQQPWLENVDFDSSQDEQEYRIFIFLHFHLFVYISLILQNKKIQKQTH